MRLALAAARRANGRTFPNPPVGAVVVRGDRVLGRGHTRPPGGPHAEVVAMADARRRHGARTLRGATLAVTLEPCSHAGRTGPCTEAIVAEGIGRVWVGHVDPHPLVSGRGIRALERAGIQTATGIREAECRDQHRGFLSRVERGLPFVTLKLAATLDGRIATARGESRWITGERARAVVHRLRARADAVLVGSGTALADDPELTVRAGGRVLHRPIRVVVDSRLRLPQTARCLRGADPERTWVVASPRAPAARRRALLAAGARLLETPARGGRVSPRAVVQRLAREGISEVLVEGGGLLAAAWLGAGVVDEIHWFVSPRLLGSDARPALGALGVERLSGAVRIEDVQLRRVGEDWWLRGRPARPARAVRAARPRPRAAEAQPEGEQG